MLVVCYRISIIYKFYVVLNVITAADWVVETRTVCNVKCMLFLCICCNTVNTSSDSVPAPSSLNIGLTNATDTAG